MIDRAGAWVLQFFSNIGNQIATDFMELCIVAAIVGVFLNIFGIKRWARKVTGVSLIAFLLFMVFGAVSCGA